MNQSGESVFQVTSQLIHQDLNYSVFGTYTTFIEKNLVSYYDNLSPQEFSHVTSFLAPKSRQFSLDINMFSLDIFVVDIRRILQVISKIVGKEDPKKVHKVVLGFFFFNDETRSSTRDSNILGRHYQCPMHDFSSYWVL